MNLPNKLTVMRILLVPVLVIIAMIDFPVKVYNIPLEYILVDIIFIIAAITDKVDGYLARKNNQVTTFGKFLDPIADKILVVSALIILVERGTIPAWIPIIIVFREFLVSGYRLIASQSNGKVIAANKWGKLKTVTQMVAIILTLIDVNPIGSIFTSSLTGFNFVLNLLDTLLMFLCVIATIFSGYEYLKDGKDILKDM